MANIEVNARQLHVMAQNYKTHADNMKPYLQELVNETNAVDTSCWTGQSKMHFDPLLEQYNVQLTNLIHSWENIAVAIEQAACSFEEADETFKTRG